MVQAGIDINHADEQGYTPLLWNAGLSNTEIVQKLLAVGANPRTTTKDGQTALQMAARYTMIEMMRCLTDAEVKVEACDLPGN